ncbi:MAG: rRNA maturation RNase YbeY [Rhodothermia bacterium]|nr:rRNA maturation RNase YbeY [Rhodothermia bacterium]
MISDSQTEAGDIPTGIDVSISHPTLTVDAEEIKRFVAMVVLTEEVRVDYLGVILCERDRHQELHRSFLGDPAPTDVLAFDLEPGSESVDGEVYVDLDTANQRHREFGSTFREEVLRYVVHGVLHLVGYRDKNSTDAEKMRTRQETLLQGFLGSDSDRPD